MKYSENNPPLVCMQTNSKCYKGTRKMEIKGILWHDTGANNPNLKRYVQPSDNAPDREYWLKILGKNQYNNDWNHTNRQAGMNCWVGKLADGTVATVQTMPWDYRPWGCGSGSKGSCNNGWIQFEICEDGKNDQAYFEAAYKEACEITAFLCRKYGIDPHGTAKCGNEMIPTILCHQDSHKLGLGSNHSDIYDWFPKYGKNMDSVRDDVARLLAEDILPVSLPVDEPHALPSSDTRTEEQTIWDTLFTAIGNAYGTAGVMGNLYAESGLHPNNLQGSYEKKLGMTDAQYTAAVDENTYTSFVEDKAGYSYLIAQASGDREESESQLHKLEGMAEQEWCCATTLGDIYTQRQEYDRAITWYRKGQEIQPSPKFTDSAMSIAHICEIRGDKAGAIDAYRELLRLQREEWGIVSGEEREEVERAIQRLQ